MEYHRDAGVGGHDGVGRDGARVSDEPWLQLNCRGESDPEIEIQKQKVSQTRFLETIKGDLIHQEILYRSIAPKPELRRLHEMNHGHVQIPNQGESNDGARRQPHDKTWAIPEGRSTDQMDGTVGSRCSGGGGVCNEARDVPGGRPRLWNRVRRVMLKVIRTQLQSMCRKLREIDALLR